MSSNSSASSRGIGFCGVLTVLFIGLKLMNKIDWSWLWVLSPLWIPSAVVIAVFICIGMGLVFGAFIQYARKLRARDRRRVTAPDPKRYGFKVVSGDKDNPWKS